MWKHSLADAAPTGAIVPSGHVVHALLLLWIDSDWYVLRGHLTQFAALLSRPVFHRSPAAQPKHSVAPSADTVPAGHATQFVPCMKWSRWHEPVTQCALPRAGQSLTAVPWWQMHTSVGWTVVVGGAAGAGAG